MRSVRLVPLMVIATVAATSPGLAGHATKVKGTVSYTMTHVSDGKMHEAGWTLSRDVMVGTIKSAIPGSPIDGSVQTCIGGMAVNAGKAMRGSGYCDTVDKDGDVWWLACSATPKKSGWRVVGGTGKYQGLRGQGTTFYAGDAQAAQASGWTQGYDGHLTFK